MLFEWEFNSANFSLLLIAPLKSDTRLAMLVNALNKNFRN